MPNVYISKWQEFRRAQVSEFIVIYGLLPHEHQMSAVNVVLRRVDEGSVVPIKSKEPLIIQCGYRRYTVNPIFSQHTNGDKHKVSCTYFQMIYFKMLTILDLFNIIFSLNDISDHIQRFVQHFMLQCNFRHHQFWLLIQIRIQH